MDAKTSANRRLIADLGRTEGTQTRRTFYGTLLAPFGLRAMFTVGDAVNLADEDHASFWILLAAVTDDR